LHAARLDTVHCRLHLRGDGPSVELGPRPFVLHNPRHSADRARGHRRGVPPLADRRSPRARLAAASGPSPSVGAVLRSDPAGESPGGPLVSAPDRGVGLSRGVFGSNDPTDGSADVLSALDDPLAISIVLARTDGLPTLERSPPAGRPQPPTLDLRTLREIDDEQVRPVSGHEATRRLTEPAGRAVAGRCDQ